MKLPRLLPRILILALLVGAAVSAVEYSRRHPSLPEVEVAESRWDQLVGEWSATGYVECRTARVTAPQVGRVVEMRAAEGETVRAGQVLARLSTTAEQAAVGTQVEGIRVAAADAARADMSVEEMLRLNSDRIRRAQADLDASRARRLHAIAALDQKRSVARATIQAARARAEAARQEVINLEAGPRPAEIAQAEAILADTEAAVVRARLERDRQAGLYRERAVPRRAVEDAEEAMARAEANVRRTRAALELVKQGVRPGEIAAARARTQAAEEEIRTAEAQLTALDAEEKGLDELVAGVRSAEAGLAEARSMRQNVGSLRQEARAAGARVSQAAAAARQSRVGLTDRVVLAPFAGSIGRRLAHPGDIASPSTPLFTLVESAHAWVSAEVDAQDLAPVEVGGRVDLSVPAYPGRAFPARVENVGAEATPQTEVRTSARIVRVRITLDGLPARDRTLLKPGMEVHVAGKAVLSPRALLVPNDAIQADSSGSFVFLVDPDRIARRPVQTGFAGATETQVVQGLKGGEKVVVSGKEGLKPGLPVRMKDDRGRVKAEG